MADNVRFLRSGPDWGLKVFAVVFYLYWAYTYGYSAMDSLMLVVVWAALYWMFVLRQFHKSHRMKRQHWIIIGVLLLLLLLSNPVSMIPMLGMMALFWFAIEKRNVLGRGTAPHYLRYHMLNATVVNAVLLMIALLLRATTGLLTALLSPILPVEALTSPLLSVWPLLIVIVNLAFAVIALLDRTPRIPWLSRMLEY